MPKRRKNIVELAQSGTLGKNLGKYANRIAHAEKRADPIGKAPVHLSVGERRAWTELVKNYGPALQRSDRTFLEVLCRLLARLRDSRTVTKTAEMNLLARLLGQLDKRRLDAPPAQSKIEDEDDWADLD